MKSRQDKIGIKQVIRLEWMDKTLDMFLAGMSSDEIRIELSQYLANKRQSGGTGERGEKTYVIAIGILMQTWCKPDVDIKALRDDALAFARQIKIKDRLPLHWAMISASYPFWAEVAKQTGRLLNLQNQVTQQQIVKRLKEQYGDRPTISRYARYVIRSFISWGILNDTERKGCYKRCVPIEILTNKELLILIESSLLTFPEGMSALGVLLNSPSFFPFNLPVISGDLIAHNSSRITVVRYGIDEHLKLQGDKC